jgi:hypothetical protein
MELEERLERAYEDMLLALEGAIARLLEADKRVRESYWGDKVVPEVVTRVFRRALEKKVDRILKRAVLPAELKFKNSVDDLLNMCKASANRDAAHRLAHQADFSPDLVLEMVRALERAASELLQALEDARRVALRVGRRCLEKDSMRELARRAGLRRMQKT